MRREGVNPDAVDLEDVLCDFCARSWAETSPMIEGHHGACICGDCLTAAWRAVVLADRNDAEPGWSCTMCLETDRPDAAFRSPNRPVALVCRRCIELAGNALRRDRDESWEPPTLA